jgi:GAF domain-containing protein
MSKKAKKKVAKQKGKKKATKQILEKPFALARAIGDLPSYHYHADTSESTEKIVEKLKKQPELPGVILFKDKKFFGAVSRSKIFEWLGRPYGVELFFKKPIHRLFEKLDFADEIYAKDMQIGDAVRKSLSRNPEARYEPLVISFGKDDLHLLDMNVLLLAQSEQLSSANHLIEKQVEIGKVLSSSLELPKVLALILEQMDSIIPYSRAAILLYRNNEMEFAASRGYPENVNMDEARVLVNNSRIFANIIQLRQLTIVEDASLRDDWQHIPGTPPTRSWLGVPLIHNERVLGMLSVSRLVIAPFTAGEVEASSIFAGQAAIALGNANLYEEVQKFVIQLEDQQKSLQQAVNDLNQANQALTHRANQLATSNQIGKEVTSIPDVRQLLSKVMGILQTQFNYSWVSVWLVDEAQKNLVLEACTKASIKAGHSIALSHKGLAATACRTGQLACDNDIFRSNLFVPTLGLRNAFSEISVPLKFQNDVIGVLDIQSERLQAFGNDEFAVLQVTASQIAVAIRNARSSSELMRFNTAQNTSGPTDLLS